MVRIICSVNKGDDHNMAMSGEVYNSWNLLITIALGLANLGVLIWTLNFARKNLTTAQNLQNMASQQIGEMIRQRRLSIAPAFSGRLDGILPTAGRYTLKLKNIGSGRALNVQVQRINFPPIEGVEEKSTYIVFEPINSVTQSENEIIVSHRYGIDENQEGPVAKAYGYTGADLLGRLQSDFKLQITFQDLEGARYTQDLIFQDQIKSFFPTPIVMQNR